MKCVVAAVVLGGYAAAFAHPQAVSSTTQIQAGAYTGQPPLNPALAFRTVDLWPDGAPGALGMAASDASTLNVFAARPEHRNGTDVIIALGGAYLALSADVEGRDVAACLRRMASLPLFCATGWARSISIPCHSKTPCGPCGWCALMRQTRPRSAPYRHDGLLRRRASDGHDRCTGSSR